METWNLIGTAVILGERQETLQQNYDSLLDLFKSEARLRAEVADWFEKFIIYGNHSMNEQARKGIVHI